MSRHLQFIALCAGLLASAGCSGPPSPGVIPPPPSQPPGPPPQPPSTPQQLAALALFEAVDLHMSLTTSPLIWAEEFGTVWPNGPCFDGSGQGSLDGDVSPAPGTFLPTGSHTYVVSFSNCQIGFFGGSTLDGVASVAYNAPDWRNVTAMVSADSVRGRGLGSRSKLSDLTADGSAVWTTVESTIAGSMGSTRTTTYTPATGSRLVNNSTTNVATFGGGSYTVIAHGTLSDNILSIESEMQFDNLRVAINGTEYTLSGRLDTTWPPGHRGPGPAYSGEIRISK